ncbi:MAG: hypothetical protein R3Y64_00225 [Peptostreptococcaceae bacterium]
MNYKLVNYNGINYKKQNSKWIINYTINDLLIFDENIVDILSFSVENTDTSYKNIDFFEQSNLDNNSFFGNIVILKTFLYVNIEYSNKENPSKISAKTFEIKNAYPTSLNDYSNLNLNIKTFISDLFCSMFCENTISYSINLTCCIDEC